MLTSSLLMLTSALASQTGLRSEMCGGVGSPLSSLMSRLRSSSLIIQPSTLASGKMLVLGG